MKLLKDLGTRLINGQKVRYAIFWCDFCKQEVEKRLQQGLRDKSCGCVTNKLKSEGNKGKKKSEEHRQKMKENHADFSGGNHPMYGVHRFGEDSPNWSGGKSFEEYGIEFNKPLRLSILERDNYICQNPDCEHLFERLDVHHIDYDKKNNDPKNLTTLCISCHMKTNGKNNRKYFTEFYKNIMEMHILDYFSL